MREDEPALRRDAEEEPGGNGAGPAAQDGGRRVVWRAGPAGSLTEPQSVALPPAWRLFLLGDAVGDTQPVAPGRRAHLRRRGRDARRPRP